MDYLKLSENISAFIKNNPKDREAYTDLFSLCREWEREDFVAAHGKNKELQRLSTDVLQICTPVDAEFFYELYRKTLLFDAPHDFDSFLLYVEIDRPIEKKFYQPRRHYLRPIVQGYQEILDGTLRLLTVSMPKRAGKSQIGINFVNMLSGRNPERSSLMEGTGDDLVKSFYNGCLEYLLTPNEYLFYDVFPDARLVQTNADTYLGQLAQQDPSEWSAEARAWAEGNGIIVGDGSGNKQYKNFCTREQMVVFMNRLAEKLR